MPSSAGRFGIELNWIEIENKLKKSELINHFTRCSIRCLINRLVISVLTLWDSLGTFFSNDRLLKFGFFFFFIKWRYRNPSGDRLNGLLLNEALHDPSVWIFQGFDSHQLPCLFSVWFLLNPLISITPLQRLLRWPCLSHKLRIIRYTPPPPPPSQRSSNPSGVTLITARGLSNLTPI